MVVRAIVIFSLFRTDKESGDVAVYMTLNELIGHAATCHKSILMTVAAKECAQSLSDAFVGSHAHGLYSLVCRLSMSSLLSSKS